VSAYLYIKEDPLSLLGTTLLAQYRNNPTEGHPTPWRSIPDFIDAYTACEKLFHAQLKPYLEQTFCNESLRDKNCHILSPIVGVSFSADKNPAVGENPFKNICIKRCHTGFHPRGCFLLVGWYYVLRDGATRGGGG
jgi:hypothetical protein